MQNKQYFSKNISFFESFIFREPTNVTYLLLEKIFNNKTKNYWIISILEKHPINTIFFYIDALVVEFQDMF